MQLRRLKKKFMKTKLIKAAIVAAVVLFTAPMHLQAQIIIGDAVAPQPFSALEIISTTGGLRLPQLDNDERDAVQAVIEAIADNDERAKAEGLMIFNTDTECVETWNGDGWISLCDNNVSQINLNDRRIFPITSFSGNTYDLNELIVSVEPLGAIGSVTWEVLSVTGTDVTVELNGSNITFNADRFNGSGSNTTLTVKATATDGSGTYIEKELQATTGYFSVRGSSSCIYAPVYSGQYLTGLVEGVGAGVFCEPPYFESVSKPGVKLRYLGAGGTMTLDAARNFCQLQGMRLANLAEYSATAAGPTTPGDAEGYGPGYWTSTPASATEQWGYNLTAIKVSNTGLRNCICVFEGPHVN